MASPLSVCYSNTSVNCGACVRRGKKSRLGLVGEGFGDPWALADDGPVGGPDASLWGSFYGF